MENEYYIYLDEVVNQYLSQFRLPDSAYDRVAQIAIRGRKELHLHSCGKPVTIELEVLANKTVKLPCDILNVLSVSIDNGDSNLTILTETDDLYIENGYNIDHENMYLRFGTAFTEKSVLVECLLQASQDGDYLVHPIFVEPLINFIIWQDNRGDRRVPAGVNRENERLFYNSLRLARRAIKPFNLDQAFLSYKRILNNALGAYRWS